MPKGWMLAPIGELARINPREFDREPGDEEHVSFVPMTLVEAGSGRLDSSGSRLWRDVRKGYTRFQENDVLFAKITPCMENAKFALAANLISGRGAGSTEFHVIRATAAILPKFILYHLLQERVRREARLSMRGAAGQLRVPPEFIDRLEIPVAPVPEQARIIEEIEKQFTRLDAAVAALQRVQINLKRFRAAVFKTACEGHLVLTEVELARSEGRPYEPASVLLDRTVAQRRCRWEARQLAKARSTGRDVSKGDLTGAYNNPSEANESSLPILPQGWKWATLSQLSEIQGGIQKQPSRRPEKNPYPFLRVANVLRGRLDTNEMHEVELFDGELEKLRLDQGDLLIVEGNGSPSEIGRMAIWKSEIENCVHQNHIIRARLLGGILSRYVEAYWNSPEGTASVLEVASSTSGLYTLSVSKVGRIPIPLPPSAEQVRIVEEIDRRLSSVEEIEGQLELDLRRAARLRQSILKQAFGGTLVPQDPTDEAASVLVERIRVEQAAQVCKGRLNSSLRRLNAKFAPKRVHK
jgi:type I restriction enzyme S subunit